MDSDPYRILGIRRDATKEQVHQAYRDLARVWHPDRFQSDPRLQQIAQERLAEINDAYRRLRTGDHTQRHYQRANGSEAGPAATSKTSRNTTAGSRTPPFRPYFPNRHLRRLVSGRLLSILAMTVGGFAFFGIAAQLISLLRPPVLDIDLIEGRARLVRPQILTPSRILDISGGVELAADTLTEWARGEALDLWKPVSSNATRTPGPTIEREIPIQAQQGSEHSGYNPRHSAAERLTDIRNGMELIATGHASGAGELRFVNNTELEEIATVLQRRIALRAIYIKPKNEALLRSIDTGIYDVHLELGRGLNLKRMQFNQNRFTPDSVGPFEFISFTTAAGTTGQRYEVVVNPPSGPSASSSQSSH
jgi:hypothetical protein